MQLKRQSISQTIYVFRIVIPFKRGSHDIISIRFECDGSEIGIIITVSGLMMVGLLAVGGFAVHRRRHKEKDNTKTVKMKICVIHT